MHIMIAISLVENSCHIQKYIAVLIVYCKSIDVKKKQRAYRKLPFVCPYIRINPNLNCSLGGNITVLKHTF